MTLESVGDICIFTLEELVEEQLGFLSAFKVLCKMTNKHGRFYNS